MVGSESVKHMIKKNFPSLSSLGSDGNTSFLRAARAGHLDKVLEHLRNSVDINTSNTNGLNALHLASKDGHVAVVTELLKRGASVDSATKKGNTALHIASLAGQEEVVRLLVEHGASVNVQSQNGFTPLYMAAQENHDNVVKYLLANGANQSLATEDGFTPLAVAMQQGHDKVVAVLLENDTRGKVRLPALHIAAKKDDCKAAALLLQNEHNPDVTSKSGFTPLHIASHYGNEGIANLLLNKGADVNYSAKHNITPLHVAAKWGKSNMVSLLLEKGANIESRTRDGLTPLHCAARSGHEQVVDMLLERSAPISSKTKNGLAPLHMSSQGDHVDAARILLYHRAPVDEVTVDYLTALHVAAHCGHARVAKLLLDRKADPNARALNGFTPLHIACKKNRIKVVELLLKHGASIEATTESGLTPLHVASFMGCMNIVIYLLQNEANPDVPTVRGETPLHLAARANQTDIIRILLRNGAQVDARAREQQTPLHIAARLGNVDIVMLLLQHGAAADCTTKDLYSALHIAAKEGQDEVASVLLENGASPTATTKKGFTPLHLAAKYGNMKVARLLLQRDAPVDAQGKNGVTPLHVASHYDHQNVALLLLDKGASPHATAKNGHTPLHIAAKKNQMDIATTLLEYGAKASAESKAGFTPLHLSAQEGHTDMSCLLLDHHADTNHKAKNGLTPLHLCAQEDRVNVASVLVKNGAEVNATTKAGYTPLHVACHFGQLAMVKFLLEEGGDVAASTAVGYTPLHQAAQQGHCAAVNCLLERGAPPNSTTNQGQTALSIAQKLGYISVVETLKGVTEVTTITPTVTDEKYKVVSPETMQETFMSDSEDEGGEDTLLSEQPYRYLTVDEMKSLGDDSLPIDVRQDERQDSNRECMTVPPTAVDDTISPQHLKEAYSQFTTPDNIDITKHPLHVGFLVSFLVDARGGAMRGCRHSGVRVIVPPRRASMPVRVTCRYLKRDKLSHPPPLMEGEALASRILELGPVGAKFLGPVMIEVPHFGSLRGKEREIVILRSDNGETWREHTVDCSEEAVQDVLSHSFDKEDLNQLEENARTTRILTTDFPHYFAVVTRVRQEVHAIGPEGGMVSSSVVPQVQAVFPQGALTKKIKVGLQAQPISAELAAKLLGNRVAVSPIVTVEPRRRKFHKPITLTIPKPQAANKGMINQYSGDAPTLRLLCSITGGTTRAQWEDVTGSTPFTFVNDCVSFTTTVSARFWLMDCRNVGDATKMATELYREAIHVPFMAKFVVFAKRVDPLEARLRIFCMTDDKEDKTLEHQEHFTEVAKSRDVEVLEGKTQYVEFAGNLVPVTKSGEQLQLGFRAFRENRLPFTVRVKDPHADCVGRTLFMREARLPKGEPPQQPICVLNIVLPEEIIPEAIMPEHELHKYSFIQDSSGLESYQRVDLRLSDISNLLGEDWPRLAEQLEVAPSHINRLKSEQPHSVAQQGLAMLRWWLSQAGNKAQASTLETALSRIGRDDIVQQCVFNVDQSGLQLLKEESRDASIRRTIPYSDKDIMKDSESIEDLSRDSSKKSGDIEKDDKEERKYEAEEKEVEEVKKSVSERRRDIEKRLSLEKPIEKKTETIIVRDILEKEGDFSEKEIAVEKRVSSPEEEPSELSFEQKRLSFEQGKRVIEMKPDNTTMKEVKERAEDSARLLAEERRIAEAVKEHKSQVDESSIPFQEKRNSFEQGVKEDRPKDQSDAVRRDSALFEGVSQGLIHLDAAYTAAPQVQDLLSPKVSKTPPPSPAEFKDITGTVAWTDDSPAVTPSKPERSQDWAGKGKPDSTIEPSKQRIPSDGTKEVVQSQLEDPSQISVTYKVPQQITETIDIKTTENKVKDLEKDLKYQFTMVVKDKQTFKDTVNSVTEFLESEKNYNFEQNKLIVDRMVTLADTEVTSSDETDGSQSKSESEPKSDKSFVGKMSKKLFKVFKKDGKDKDAKKKGGKKKHKEEEADRAKTPDENPNHPDDSKKFDLTNLDSKIVDKEVVLTDTIVVEVADRKYKNNSTEGEKQPVTFSGQINHERDVEHPENENREQKVDSSFQISKEKIENTEMEMRNLSIEDSNALAMEGGKDRENISAISYSDKEAKNKSETILKELSQFTIYPAEKSKSVQLKEFESDSCSGIVEEVNTHKKDTIPEETLYLTKENTSEKHSEGVCKDVLKSVKDDVILNIKSLSDRAEESYLEKKDEVKTVTKSTIESAEQGTIYVTDTAFENLTDTSKKVVEPFEHSKDKSKSFFSGLFSKKKDEGKVDSLSTVIIVDDKSTKSRKYGVDETFNKTSDEMKGTNINSVDSAISSSEQSIGKVEESVSPDEFNGKIVSDYQPNEVVTSDSSSTQINKEKKSFFGSLFGKGDTTADEGHPIENASFSEIPDVGDEINKLGNKFISDKVEIVDGTVEVGKISKHVENNKVPVSDGVTEDLKCSKIKDKDPTVDFSAPTFKIKDAGNDISELATSNIEENLKSTSESVSQSRKEKVPIVGETSGGLIITSSNITDNVTKDVDKETHVYGLEIISNGEKRLGIVIDDHINDNSQKIIFEDKTKNLDAVDSIIGTLYQKNDISPTGIVEGEAESIIEEITEKAKTAILSKENNSGKLNSSTIKIDSSVTFSEEKSEPKKVVQETEKIEAPAFNPIQIMNIGKNILNDGKDKTSKAATYTKDKVVSSVTSLCEPVDSFKQKNLKGDDDLCISNMPENTEEIPKSITGTVDTEHVLANERPIIIETNKNTIIESLPSTTGISSNITCNELSVQSENTIKNDVLKIVEQSKEVKDKTVTLYDNVILNSADITDNTSSKIIDDFTSIGEKAKKIGEDTKTTKKDISDQAENLLIQGKIKASNIVQATSSSIKTKMIPAVENITTEIKHNTCGGKQTYNNDTSSTENVSNDDKYKIGDTLTSIKTDLQFDASQDDSKIVPNVHIENVIETDEAKKINDAENVIFGIKDGLIKVDTDVKSESTKNDDEVTNQNIKKILEKSAIESVGNNNHESVANVADELHATKGIVLGNLSKEGSHIPHNIDVSLKIKTETTQPSETYSFKPCVINETPLNVGLLSKTESMKKTSDQANTNDDKLNNILIDMLIEQECMKNSLSDISNQLFSETSKEMEEASSLPEKHDTEVSEKRKKSVTSSPFKTAASFGEVESLISEEELKSISDSEFKESSSYVTTPTMQRRKIGGSQRLSREERPALREMTHMEYSSSDDDEANYIVTEPFDRATKRTVTFQIDSEDEAYLKVSDSNSDPEIEVTEMTPSPDPTSKKQAQVAVEEEAKQDNQTKYNSDKNAQKVERRFERMASETLESDPAVKFTTDRDFQRMISQLSNEEVDACLSQWDEGGLTPSEELDSTKDTIEGDLDLELEALPEASLEPTNPFYSSSPEWSGFQHNMTNTPDSLFWAFDSTPTSAIIQPNELDIPIQSVHVKGESAGEEAKKSPGPASTREGEEALLDLAVGVQDKTQSAAGSGPSSAK